MKFLSKSKDGGPESTVWAYWLFEIKWLGSIVLLKFENGSRDAYHSHAFNSVSWVLTGALFEDNKDGKLINYWPSFLPVFTWRSTFHKVKSMGRSWVLSFRGPWTKTWIEQTPDGKQTVLTDGRKLVNVFPADKSEEFKEKLRQFGASREE